MLTLAFWKATAERMVRTFAQAVLGIAGADGLGLLNSNWGATFAVGGLAAVATLLTAIVTSGGPVGPGLTETVATLDTPRRPTSI